MLTKRQQFIKRIFDIIVSFFGLLLFIIPIFLMIIISRFQTGLPGLFIQKRVGKYGGKFYMFKIRTLKENKSHSIEELSSHGTFIGKLLRRSKLDELPQLINVLKGDMSLVGPRPDVPGYADQLKGSDRIILSVRPGITGPATIKYKNEEEILLKQTNPQQYNDSVVWPDKVKINKDYVENWSFLKDLKYIYQSVF
jgi:lipopolysaccharide/colanic/teichoic acid biosynthesis glycosyltransferase